MLLFVLFKKDKKGLLSLLIFFPFFLSATPDRTGFDLLKTVKNPELVINAKRAFEAEDWSAAELLYHELLEYDSDNAALYYNTGLIKYKQGKTAEAVYYIRKATILKPWLTPARKNLPVWEKELGLEHQLPPPVPIRADFLIILFLIMINVVLILTVQYLKEQRIRYIIMILSFIFVSLFSLCGGVVSYITRNRPYGIVSVEGCKLKKVPGEKASEWLDLNPGTSLMVMAEVGGYYHIKTGYDVEGWIKEGDFYQLKKTRDLFR